MTRARAGAVGTARSCALSTLLLVALALPASVAQAQVNASSKNPSVRASVVSGTPADPALYPYVAAVKSEGDVICGGSLISLDRVLTAAHCIENLVIGDAVVVGPAAARKILHVAQDPRLTALTDAGRDPDDVLPYDIAILQLDAAVTDLPPIRLAQPADASLYAPGALLTTVGLGSIDRTGAGSGVLRFAAVAARADADCTSLLTPLASADSFVAATMICTTDPDGAAPFASSCYGDSGSPLVATAPDGSPVQVGVDDWGVACGFKNGDPENYVEVPSIAEFALSPAPVFRPEPISRPKFTGTPKVGRKVRCSKPRFNDPQPDKVTRAFYVASGSSSRIVARATGTYRIPRSLRGQRLSCVVLAHSAGGEIVKSALSIKRVL